MSGKFAGLMFLAGVLLTIGISKEDKIKEALTNDYFTRLIRWLVLLVLFSMMGLLTPALVLLSVSTLAIFPLWGYSAGESQADRVKKEYTTCDKPEPTGENKCIFLMQNDEQKFAGILVARSSTYIAIWDGEKAIVEPLKDYRVEAGLTERGQL